MDFLERGGRRYETSSLVAVVRLDQCQQFLFELTANKLDVARFCFVVDYPYLVQFWEMSVVKLDPDALSVFVRFSLRVFVANSVCYVVYERLVFQCTIGSTVQCVDDGPSVFVRYCRQNCVGGNRSLLSRTVGEIVEPL